MNERPTPLIPKFTAENPASRAHVIRGARLQSVEYMHAAMDDMFSHHEDQTPQGALKMAQILYEDYTEPISERLLVSDDPRVITFFAEGVSSWLVKHDPSFVSTVLTSR